MNKKLLSLLVALVMVLGLFALPAFAEEESTEPVEPENMTDADTLVIGAPQLSGSYINGFGNDVYDIYIKSLIGNYGDVNSYTTLFTDNAGQAQWNMTVLAEEPSTEVNEDGSKTYTFKIVDDLVWNDGTAITAKDYVFGILQGASPQWLAQGAQNASSSENLVGFEEFQSGASDEMPGVELIDDYTFTITLKADKLPYFYESIWTSASPTPRHRLAPNIDVVGSKLVVVEGYEPTDADRQFIEDSYAQKVEEAKAELQDELDWWENYQAEAKEEEEISEDDIAEEEDYIAGLQEVVDAAQQELDDFKDGKIELNPLELLLTESCLDTAYTYRFNPDVTAGPYNFVSFGNNMAKATLNETYKGNAYGVKPTIKNVIVQTVNSQMEVDYVLAGILDLSPDNTEQAKINKAKDSQDKCNLYDYARNGYGQFRIRNDFGPTQYKGVRKALAYSIDRDQFVSEVSGGYAIVVDGHFGIAQFEYADKGEELEDNENWVHYTLNADMANQCLDTDSPYIYEADGTTPWDAEKAQQLYEQDPENFDYWRYDENGVQCRIIEYGSQGIDTTNLILIMMPDNCKRVGINFIVKPVDWATLSADLDKDTPEDPNALTDQASCFNMGIGFSVPNDPYYAWHSSQIGVGDNKNRVNDPVVDEILVRMRNRDPEDVEGWEEDWVQFQLWFNDNMPEIPLYANQYYTVASKRVTGLDDLTPMWPWYNCICVMTLDGE